MEPTIMQQLEEIARYNPAYSFLSDIVKNMTASYVDGKELQSMSVQAMTELMIANKLINLPGGYQLVLSLYYVGGISKGVAAKATLLMRAKTGDVPTLPAATKFSDPGNYVNPRMRYSIRAIVLQEAGARQISFKD